MENLKTELTTFGELKPGDKIIGADGQPVEVTAVYDKHFPDKMYEIELEDGEIVRASGNHMWYCETEEDSKFKEEYSRLAKKFFDLYDIPEKLEEDELFPTEDLIQIFGQEVETMLFIEKACKSLGYSSYTPHMVFDGFKEDISNRGIVMNYSYNDFVDFLQDMKRSLLENKGYFYFGEVRTTDEIFDLIEKGADINIPYKEDIQKGGL